MQLQSTQFWKSTIFTEEMVSVSKFVVSFSESLFSGLTLLRFKNSGVNKRDKNRKVMGAKYRICIKAKSEQNWYNHLFCSDFDEFVLF